MQGSVGQQRKRAGWVAYGVMALACAAITVVQAQGPQGPLTLYVSAVDANGASVSDIKPEEISYKEGTQAGKIISVEKFSLPVKLTIAVDNGKESPNALGHYRTGLTDLIKELPPDVEVTLITMAPQPRINVKPTTNREEINRGITRFGPDDESARFTDTLVEWSQRLDKDAKDKKLNYNPMLIMVSTTAAESTSYQRPELEKAMSAIVRNGGRLSVAMTTTRVADNQAIEDMNSGRQALIAIPLVKSTRGRYEALAQSSRLTTLLPEFGKMVAAAHLRQVNQIKVVIERPTTGPINDLDVRLLRPGLNGAVSGDGRFFP